MSSIEILIPNRHSWNGICLTVESIIKRTAYDDYSVTVCDNSMAPNKRACEPHEVKTLDGDDGNRLEYLRAMARLGYIRLIENAGQGPRYGHGENIKRLIEGCRADCAMLLNSSTEIIAEDWLTCLAAMLRTPQDLGVARFRPGGVHDSTQLRPPVFWPNVMFLNMREYRKIYDPRDFDLLSCPVADFGYPELWAMDAKAQELIARNALVFADTGWRLYARILRDNPFNYRMLPLPDGYFPGKIQLYGGIDRNSHRPQIPYVKDKLAAIDERLARLRKA